MNMKFQLTRHEKQQLFLEAIGIIVFLGVFDIAVYISINEWIQQNPGLEGGVFQDKMSLSLGPNRVQVGNWGFLFLFLACVFDVFILYWRLLHRYYQMQMLHIIKELHYIASGHFDHRIPFKLVGPMNHIVESINILVDGTTHAMKEERAMEKSKDELITNVSHDIRTPLTSIIGYLGLIESRKYKNETDLLKFAHIAFLKSKQMKSLVDDLFEYTKVRQADTPLNLIQISLNSLFEQLEADFELEAQKKGMKITSEIPKEDLKIEVDPEKFARIFNNLITNALKYGKGGKNIYLKATKVKENEIEVSVSNDGQPIPQEALSQIFERFYRVEKSRNTKTGGTGLGLAITQQIVDLHHGTIKVESNDDLTSFIMHFPIKQPQKRKEVKEIS